MASSKPFGLSPIDMQVLHLVAGAGNPMMYGGLGLALSSMHRWGIPEHLFKPRFLNMCKRGLITWVDWDQGYDHFKNRKVKETLRGESAIRDMAILHGGDYSWYRHFDPRDMSTLDKYMPGKQSVSMAGGQRRVSKKQAFRDHLENVKKDPKKFYWR